MFKRSLVILAACAACATMVACSSSTPRVIQASSDSPSVHLTGGMATQIEMPNGNRVQSATVGDPTLVTADYTANVVNLVPKKTISGQTNLIVRAVDDDGDAKIYQYRVEVQGQ